MPITSYIQEIGASDHKLAMRDLKPLSGLGREEREDFWPAWIAIMPRRRAEIARSMVELAEDDIELDFSAAQIWMLDDDDAVFAGEAHQQFTRLGRLFIGHAGGRFVDQQKLWILREQHADFEPLLLSV